MTYNGAEPSGGHGAEAGVETINFDEPGGHWSMAIKPSPPLFNAYIDQFWEIKGNVDYSSEKILPSGNMEFMVNLGKPHCTLNPLTGTVKATNQHAWLAGLHDCAIISAPTYDIGRDGSHFVAVSFTPIGARAFLGIGGASFTNNIIELSDFISDAEVSTLRNMLWEVATPGARFDILLQFLLSRRPSGLMPISPHVLMALNTIITAQGDVRIDSLCDYAGISRKSLNQQFMNDIGMSPKKYARLHRFSAIISNLASQRHVDWAEIAYSAGFYDQTHFIKEFKAFSGETPTSFMRDRDDSGKGIVYY